MAIDWQRVRAVGEAALLRAGRAALAVAVSLVLAQLAAQPDLVWIAPVLLGVDKAVRQALEEK